jgi:hypothetical protein
MNGCMWRPVEAEAIYRGAPGKRGSRTGPEEGQADYPRPVSA